MTQKKNFESSSGVLTQGIEMENQRIFEIANYELLTLSTILK